MPADFGQLPGWHFVFQPEHHPTLLSLSGARAGTDSRFPDLVLSWESWSPPHVHYNFIKGMDSSAYRLTLRAYDGPTASRRLWQLLKDHVHQGREYDDPHLQFASEEETYNTIFKRWETGSCSRFS